MFNWLSIFSKSKPSYVQQGKDQFKNHTMELSAILEGKFHELSSPFNETEHNNHIKLKDALAKILNLCKMFEEKGAEASTIDTYRNLLSDIRPLSDEITTILEDFIKNNEDVFNLYLPRSGSGFKYKRMTTTE